MTGSWFRRLMLAGPWAWAGLFFLLPLEIIFKISLAQTQVGVPPYTSLFAQSADGLALQANLANYRDALSDPFYFGAYLGSLKIALIATVIALLIGYPMAYAIAAAPQARRGLLLLLVALPFWTSLLVRVYAWMGLLRPGGVINGLLEYLGVIQEPLHLINTTGAVCLGMVYAYLPFMVLPLYARLERLDPALREAASDLGARPWRVFLSVTLPLSMPGVIAGALLVFIPCVGEFVIPDLLGGPDTVMIGKVLWSEFFSGRDWPLSAALTVIMVAVLVVPILLLQRLTADEAAP
ncbi:MAG: ABC transporter permease subunit [Rhodospirillaceae bacterium]